MLNRRKLECVGLVVLGNCESIGACRRWRAIRDPELGIYRCKLTTYDFVFQAMGNL